MWLTNEKYTPYVTVQYLIYGQHLEMVTWRMLGLRHCSYVGNYFDVEHITHNHQAIN
jgi:hypothetical protein